MSDMLEWPRVGTWGLRILRQYCCRLEAVVSVVLIYIIWIYVRWLAERYRPGFSGRQLQTSANDLIPNYNIKFSTLKINSRNLWTYSNEEWSFCAIQGIRLSMEDRVDVVKHMKLTYYGLYDGHGGQFVSEYLEKTLSQNILQRYLEDIRNENTVNMSKILNAQILKLDAQISLLSEPLEYTGSTLVSIAIHDKRYVTIANVGDSRAIMALPNGRAQQITIDHKPNTDSEKRRIEAAGGWVSWFGVWRVAGVLATSRAIGDTYLKRAGYLIAQPDLYVIDAHVHAPTFIIVASDGLWDVVTNQHAVDIVNKAISNNDTTRGTEMLVDLAIRSNTTDNVSVMVIPLMQLHK